METRPIHKDQQGFSLIETCIAMLLIMIISSGVVPLFVYAMKYNSAAAIRAEALAVAQRKVEQLRASSFASCTSSSEVVTIGHATWSQTYTIDTTVTDTTTSLKNIQIVVTPQFKSTTGGVYSGPDGWMRGQIIIYTQRASLAAGPNLG